MPVDIWPYTDPASYGPDGSSLAYNTVNIQKNGVLDSRNPVLLPAFDPVAITGNAPVGIGFNDLSSLDAGQVYPAMNSATQASQTVTVTGTWLAGDTITATINGTACTWTVLTGFVSLTNVAQGLTYAINSNATVGQYLTATNSAGVVTITADAYPAKYYGPKGNLITLVASKSSASGVVTAGGATFAGGAGPFYPKSNNTLQYNGSSIYLRAGQPHNNPDPGFLTILLNRGII